MAVFKNLLVDPAPAVQTDAPLAARPSTWERMRSSNWGIAVACGLIAVGISVAVIHHAMVQSIAYEQPAHELNEAVDVADHNEVLVAAEAP